LIGERLLDSAQRQNCKIIKMNRMTTTIYRCAQLYTYFIYSLRKRFKG
jgi:hypothetical protein